MPTPNTPTNTPARRSARRVAASQTATATTSTATPNTKPSRLRSALPWILVGVLAIAAGFGFYKVIDKSGALSEASAKAEAIRKEAENLKSSAAAEKAALEKAVSEAKAALEKSQKDANDRLVETTKKADEAIAAAKKAAEEAAKANQAMLAKAKEDADAAAAAKKTAEATSAQLAAAQSALPQMKLVGSGSVTEEAYTDDAAMVAAIKAGELQGRVVTGRKLKNPDGSTTHAVVPRLKGPDGKYHYFRVEAGKTIETAGPLPMVEPIGYRRAVVEILPKGDEGIAPAPGAAVRYIHVVGFLPQAPGPAPKEIPGFGRIDPES